MNQAWVAKLLEAHREAIQRHLRSVAAHESIMPVLRAFEQRTITEAQALAPFEAAASSLDELGRWRTPSKPPNASASEQHRVTANQHSREAGGRSGSHGDDDYLPGRDP